MLKLATFAFHASLAGMGGLDLTYRHVIVRLLLSRPSRASVNTKPVLAIWRSSVTREAHDLAGSGDIAQFDGQIQQAKLVFDDILLQVWRTLSRHIATIWHGASPTKPRLDKQWRSNPQVPRMARLPEISNNDDRGFEWRLAHSLLNYLINIWNSLLNGDSRGSAL